ncbi:MAG: outer membrane lipoprotein-sorting protein [Myxococcota bacterium]|nr:outer membrane lipoprotein-sorting protein [Myxococcota bacterium]
MPRAQGRDWISMALGSLLVFLPGPGWGGEPSEFQRERVGVEQRLAQSEPRGVSPEAILRQAFDNQYEVDTTSEIELVMRNRGGQERTRRFQAAQKIIDNRVHSIGRLVYPEYLRDMAILQIEGVDRSHDAFVYLPSLGKSRRVSTHQRGDALFGTDVTYEDLERRYLEDYRIIAFGTGEWLGESVYRIGARPVRATSYAEIVFFIAKSDASILQADYYKRRAETPYRTLRVDRSSMVRLDGHTLATRLTIENRTRGTRTQVTFEDLRVNPDIDDRLFSVRTLEQRRDFEKAF